MIKKMLLFLFSGIFSFSSVFAAPLSLSDSRIPAFSQNKLQSIEALGVVPVGTVVAWPRDTASGLLNAWMPCDGQPIPAHFPDLASLMSHTPNLNGKGNGMANGKGFFLRGNNSFGEARSDSIRRQTHIQPEHTHRFSFRVKDPTISGIAAGQTYYEGTSAWTSNRSIITNPTPRMMQHLNKKEKWLADWDAWTVINGGWDMKMPGNISSAGGGSGGTGGFSYSSRANIDFGENIVRMDTLTDSTLSAHAFETKTDGGTLITSPDTGLIDTTVIGAIKPSGGNDSLYTGEEETRPIYADVIYMIKAKP